MKITTLLGILASTAVLVYLIGAFVGGSFDPYSYGFDTGGRVAMVFVWAVLSVVAVYCAWVGNNE